MGADIVAASTGWRDASRFLSVAALIIGCLGIRPASAAECAPHCDRRTQPSQYTDPRCESRRSGPRLDRVETRCDLREPQRKANQQTPSPSPLSPPVGQVPVIGAGDPSRQQLRSVDRDVGFDDAFTTQGNAPPAGGPAGGNANPGAGANPGGPAANSNAAEARRTPPGRAR
jgi:hypothetical protein